MKSWQWFALFAGVLYMINKKTGIITPYNDLIVQIAAEFHEDPILVKAIIMKESSFKANARANNKVEDSRGLGQVNVRQTKVLSNLGIDPSRLYEPDYNIRAICKFLRDIRTRYSKLEDIISAYNDGDGYTPKDNTSYTETVLKYYRLYQGIQA